MTESNFNFEDYEDELNTASGLHFHQIDMTNVPIFTNASVHAGEAFTTLPPGTQCLLEDCDQDHGGERVKHNIVFFDLFTDPDDDEETPFRFMVPLESPLGQAMVSGDFSEVVLKRLQEFGDQVGEPLVTWVDDPESSE